MKRLIFYMAALGLSLAAFPRTEGEKLDVARQMAIWVQSSAMYDHIDDALANYKEWDRPEVFFGADIEGWTVAEKMDAFDTYIRYIAATNCADEGSRDYVASISAIQQCCWMSRTNELASIRQFVLNTNHPYRRRITGPVLELGGLDNESVNFAETIATNVTRFSRAERGRAFGELWKKLTQTDMGDPVASNACTRITSMCYRHRHLSVAGALCIDKLLEEHLDGYAMSSNRLETASFVLSQTNCTEQFTAYFTAVTNQMLSSGQPLAVLDVGE